MKNKYLVIALATLTFVAVHSIEAQQSRKFHRIGYLSGATPSVDAPRHEAFRQGLRELGYVDGQTIAIDWRFAEGHLKKLPDLAGDLLRLKVEVVVTGGSGATRVAKDATRTTPIVMTQDSDPIGDKFVDSLAHPGGNITGLTNVSLEVTGKRLELLRDSVAALSHVMVLGNSANRANAQVLKDTQNAAQALRLKLEYHDMQRAEDAESAFKTAAKAGARALLVLQNPVARIYGERVVQLAVKYRLPAMYNRSDFVEGGGLMFYGADGVDLHRRAATYVDKILKGVKPADLPVEQPRKFELVINLKAAKQIGLTIPPNVLARADKVIR